MKERPISMSAPMVRAILAGTKTVTRRICKAPAYAPGPLRHTPTHDGPYFDSYCGERKTEENPRGASDRWCRWTADDRPDPTTEIRCPYGKPGDQLAVREAWRTVASLDDVRPILMGPTVPVRYEADGAMRRWLREPIGRYRHARFMPRTFGRITLDVVSVRVERLHEITEEDARAEGAEPRITMRKVYPSKHAAEIEHRSYRDGFAALWREINGAESWASDPFVWRVEFRRVEPADV